MVFPPFLRAGKTRHTVVLFLLAEVLVLLSACARADAPETASFVRVVVEDGSGYAAQVRVQNALQGSDVQFFVALSDGCIITGTDYPDATIDSRDGSAVVTLHNVRYSTVVRLTVEHELVTYDLGDGRVIRLPVYRGHDKMNTWGWREDFSREGYVLTGWLTEAGEHIGLGSRTDHTNRILTADWAKESSETEFCYEVSDGIAFITAYTGAELVCVVPAELGGAPTAKILAGAFTHAGIETLILPPTVIEIEAGAFAGAALREIYLYDNIHSVSSESFADCSGLERLHINAATSPVYSGTYYDTFSDKLDRLIELREQKKIVLFSGSSARFGYDSERLDREFSEYEVVNMGVFAYTNALPQLELIRRYMLPGDILIDAPEFDTVSTQFCTSNALDMHFFCMTESNYDIVALLDLRECSNVFSAFGAYLSARSGMEGKSYNISAGTRDEDGHEVGFRTYNDYGDFIYPRPNGVDGELLKFIRTDYTVEGIPEAAVQTLNRELIRFQDDGVEVFFTFAPRNISSLTESSTLQARKALQVYLTQTLAVPVISDMEDYLYPSRYFYEIDNHLSDEGVQLRTAKIIEDLRKALLKERKTGEESP